MTFDAHAHADARCDESPDSDRRRTCRAQIFWRTRSAKISAPPPGSESSPASLQLAQDLLVGPAVQIGEERDLDRREALQVNLGTDPLEAAQQLRVVLERQIRDAGR